MSIFHKIECKILSENLQTVFEFDIHQDDTGCNLVFPVGFRAEDDHVASPVVLQHESLFPGQHGIVVFFFLKGRQT
jgi:hypothetical protein